MQASFCTILCQLYRCSSQNIFLMDDLKCASECASTLVRLQELTTTMPHVSRLIVQTGVTNACFKTPANTGFRRSRPLSSL
jgi:hypothetical protein